MKDYTRRFHLVDPSPSPWPFVRLNWWRQDYNFIEVIIFIEIIIVIIFIEIIIYVQSIY